MTNATPKNAATGDAKNNGSSKTAKPFRIGGLGEVAIRCKNLENMAAFYEDQLGLSRLEGNLNPNILFFKISDGVAGHTNVLALFRAEANERAAKGGETSTLHHLALSLPYDEQENARLHFEATGVSFRIEDFDWIGWRGLFLTDPEGNTVELVAAKP